MKKSFVAELCRQLFFKTGKIGYYLLAKDIERVQVLEDEDSLTM